MRRFRIVLLILLLCVPARAGSAEFDEVIQTADWDFFGLPDGQFFGRTGDVWKIYAADGSVHLNYEWDEPPYPGNIPGYYDLTGGLFAVCPDTHSGWGLMNAAGEWLTEPVYDELNSSGEGLIRTKKDGRFGYINSNGQTIAEPIYESASDFSDGCAIVILDGKYGCIDSAGNYVFAPAYDALNIHSGAAAFRLNDHCGLMDLDGNVLLDPSYDSILPSSDGTWTASSDGSEIHFSIQNGKAIPAAIVSTSFDLTDYMPRTGAKTSTLDEPASLQLTADGAPLPRLDGATALFPLYSGIVQAVYPEEIAYTDISEATADTVFTFGNTTGAYDRLAHGECDLIFVAPPSDQQLQSAANAGVELELTTIGYEAFVFFVHRDNPLDSIATEQIRAVYSGEIADWSALGVDGIGKIVAYQRPKNSGSQSALERLMGDAPLMDPIANNDASDFAFSMSDIVNVIEYRNTPNAIGYSFRFFLTEMMDSEVKLLAVDGIEPTEENIRNQAYPLITPVCAVSNANDENPNLRALLDWLASDQGKELIRRSGYVPAD